MKRANWLPRWKRWRHAQRRAALPYDDSLLLLTVRNALQLHLPMPMLIEPLALDVSGRAARRLHQLHGLLTQGEGLADAVEQVPGLLSPQSILTLRIGSQSGVLLEAVQHELDGMRAAIPGAAHVWITPTVYVVGVSGMASLMLFSLRQKVLPTMEQILADTARLEGVPLQPMGQGLYWIEWLAWGICCLGIVMLALRKNGRAAILARILSIRPGGGAYASTHVLSMIRMALTAGRPVAGTISTMARYHFLPQVRQRLLFVRNEIEQGVSVWQSLCDGGFLTDQELRAINSAPPTATLATLDGILGERQMRSAQRRQVVGELARPVTAMLLGGLVLALGWTFLQPLVQLIWRLL